MKYLRSIIVIFFLSISSVILLLYFANITRVLEKENQLLVKKIDLLQDQININEIEYSLLNSYDYLQNMHKIYFDTSKQANINKIISFYDFKSKNIENIYTVGTK